MQLMQAFNANQFDPNQDGGGGNLPIGNKMPAIITDSEVKGTKANDGSGLLEITVTIIDGPYKGATGCKNYNLYNKNQQAVEIAHKEFSALCHVLRVYQVVDSQQLHNIPFLIDVTPQKKNPQYTEISKVYDINGNEPGKPATAQAAQPAPAQGFAQGGFVGQPATAAPVATSAPAAQWAGQPAAPVTAAPTAPATNWNQNQAPVTTPAATPAAQPGAFVPGQPAPWSGGK